MTGIALFDRITHYLVGAGVVGRAIARAHVAAGVSFALIDQDPAMLQAATRELAVDPALWTLVTGTAPGGSPAVVVRSCGDELAAGVPLVIESIAERLDRKRALFAAAEGWFGADAILCSNTSTLRIGEITAGLARPERCCGMHFFMPVDQRAAVEIIRAKETSAATIDEVSRRARRLNKQPLLAGDGPGFVVNRLLSPYLNEAMVLLGAGVSAARIEHAALAYGMPISPLELIDWIGTRTVFDAGRAFWQAFPERISPAPIGAALLKRGRLGRAAGGGFYDYPDGTRSAELAPAAAAVVQTYQRPAGDIDDVEVVNRLATPMFIEAALAYREGIARSLDQFDLAMTGGLGYTQPSWLAFWEACGSQRILAASARWGDDSASLRMPVWLAETLATHAPTAALQQAALHQA